MEDNIYLIDWTFFEGKRTFDRERKETTVFVHSIGVVVSGTDEKVIINNEHFITRALLRMGIPRTKVKSYTAVSVYINRKVNGL